MLVLEAYGYSSTGKKPNQEMPRLTSLTKLKIETGNHDLLWSLIAPYLGNGNKSVDATKNVTTKNPRQNDGASGGCVCATVRL